VSAFEEFSKIARLSRPCVVTEKIDGTNAQVYIVQAGTPTVDLDEEHLIARNAAGDVMYAGSRNRYITPQADNFGFAAWVKANADMLWHLGPGRHFGEWWGAGIQRRYGLGATGEKRFSLFNTARWGETPDTIVAPKCCHVVPVLYRGIFDTEDIQFVLEELGRNGSSAAPGFMKPEGIVIWHEAARQLFKKTLEKDEAPKSLAVRS
jgi:hypothetical protein